MCGRTFVPFGAIWVLVLVVAVPTKAQFSPRHLVEPTAKLTGTWYRQFEGGSIAVTFAERKLKICVTFNPDSTIRLTLTADYSLTKDGLVRGTITDVNWEVKPEPDAATMSRFRETVSSIGISSEALLDCSFSFQTQSTALALLVSDLKTGVDEEESIRTLFFALFNGMYTFNEGDTIPPVDSRLLTVALFISTAREIGPVFAGSEGKIAAEMAKRLPELARKNKRRVVVIEPWLVNTFRLKNPTWKDMQPTEWGKKLGADFVLDIHLDKMSLYQPGSLNSFYEGRAEVTVDTYKVMTGPQETKLRYTLSFAYPHDGVLDASSIPQNRFKHDLLERLAAEISRKQLEQKQFSLARKINRNQTFFAPARYVQKGQDVGIVAIPENTDVFPTYYRDAAKELIRLHVGPSFEVFDEYETNVGSGRTEYRMEYRKKPVAKP